MGINRGPNLIKDNLVFGYDTGYGVADPGLSTRFYKGKPTVNIASGDAFIHDTSSGGAGSVVDAPEKGPGWKKVTITAIGSNFRAIQFGSYPTMTANVLYASSFEADWGNLRGKGYVITQDGSGGGTRNYFKNGSYATGSTGNVAIDSTLLDGHIGMNIVKSASHVHVPFIYNNSTNTSGRNDYFYYKEYQQEIGTIPTPYVNGTRSSTNSLIDLKKTRSIDVGVSFDSTGQPEFDGTNDTISCGTGILSGTGDFTVEAVFKYVGTGNAGTIFANYNSGNLQMFFSPRYIGLYLANSSAYLGSSPWSGTLPEFTNDPVYMVTQRQGTVTRVYINGVLAKTGASSSTIGTSSANFSIGTNTVQTEDFQGSIYLVKAYNRALTLTEIKQNYNAYKNRFNL